MEKPRYRVPAGSSRTAAALVPTTVAPQRRHRAGLAGGAQGAIFPYDAASWYTTDMSEWMPRIHSPDYEINFSRDRMVARSRDLVRNDTWAAGALRSILDSTIGGAYRLSAMPDYMALSRHAKGFDAAWATEFRQAAEAEWRAYADDVGRYNDVHRAMTVTQQLRQAMEHMLVDGDALAMTSWMPERMGYGAAKFATAYQIVDPDRLSNPYQAMDTEFMRGGVELDRNGVPVAYHVRRAEPNDFYATTESMIWDRIAREDADGFLRVMHHFERHRAGQHRGVGVLVPAMGRLKMLNRFYGVSLQAATINSVFGTFVTSPFDQQMVEDALSPDGQEGLTWYQDMRADFHERRGPRLNDAVIPTLAPGEDIKSVSATHPTSEFGPFVRQMLLGISVTLGISVEQLTNDYSETNYSSARAAIAETERALKRRLNEFNSGVANPMYATWMDEAMERGLLPLPSGAPDFIEARAAYARCRWRGPGRGLIDGVAERQASVLGMDAGLTTLAEEVSDESGGDWREKLEQRAVEVAEFKRLNLPLPDWAGMPAQTPAKSATPEKPVAT